MLDSIMTLLEAPQGPSGPKPPPQAQRARKQKKAPKPKDPAKEAEKRRKAAEKAKKTKAKKAKEAMKAALAANKEARKKRQSELKKKQDAAGTKAKASPVGKSPSDMVNAQVRHCMLAVHHKRGKSEKAAWNICRWSLTKYGYLKGPYRVNTKLPKAIRPTQKGVRRSFQHGMEKGPLNGGIPGTGTTKARKFNKLFKKIEKDVIKKAGSR